MPIVKPAPGLSQGYRLPTGCVGYWLFNEYAGDARDLSGRRYHAEKIGTPTRPAGRYGPEASGFGVSNYFSVPQHDAFNLAARPCVSLLLNLKTDLSTQAYNGIVTKTSTGSWEDGWGFAILPGSAIAFWANFWASQYATISSPPSGYHAITGTYDPTSKRIEIWMDGVLKGYATQTHALDDVSCSTRIGCVNGTAGWPDPIVAMSISSGAWPNIPQLHSDWLAGRFEAAAPPEWTLGAPASATAIPVFAHHYAQQGVF